MEKTSAASLTGFAKLLVACERREAPSDANGEGSFPACEKLRNPLCSLFGVGGFRPLLMRAVAIAKSRVLWLSKLQVDEKGRLKGFAELSPELEPATLEEGEIALLTELLGLLVTFIGHALTASLLQQVWPECPGLSFENTSL